MAKGRKEIPHSRKTLLHLRQEQAEDQLPAPTQTGGAPQTPHVPRPVSQRCRCTGGR